MVREGEGKIGKYLVHNGDEERRRKIGEGKYQLHGGDKEWRKKKREIFGEKNILSADEKEHGEGVKYSEKGN